MPYPTGHRTAVKRKIVDSARQLFNRRGFDNVSIAEIMAGAGLTHGGFYTYFKSKSDLYSETLGCFFTDPQWKSRWKGVHVDLSSDDVGSQVVRAYLSTQHFENVRDSCPMVALPSDVARSNADAKRAFENVFAAMVGILEKSEAGKNARRQRAKAIAALCVGGMVVSRSLLDRSEADALREACMNVALELGGWNARAKKRPARLGK